MLPVWGPWQCFLWVIIALQDSNGVFKAWCKASTWVLYRTKKLDGLDAVWNCPRHLNQKQQSIRLYWKRCHPKKVQALHLEASSSYFRHHSVVWQFSLAAMQKFCEKKACMVRVACVHHKLSHEWLLGVALGLYVTYPMKEVILCTELNSHSTSWVRHLKAQALQSWAWHWCQNGVHS